MKTSTLLVMAFLIRSMAAWPQEQQSPPPPEERRAPQNQQQEQQKRPTLGPAPAPTLHGPKTSSTTDHHKLLRVRRVYIERMDHTLDEKLIEVLAKAGRLRIVGDRREADAVLHGNCIDFRRLKVLRSEVYLMDQGGGSIWQDSIRRPINPPAIEVAVRETATVIVAHLSESITEAERH
jgi:hemolysin activation/secretion protein